VTTPTAANNHNRLKAGCMKPIETSTRKEMHERKRAIGVDTLKNTEKYAQKIYRIYNRKFATMSG